ncbi:RHS repeat-associated core domain-containing protein, partial [Streptomyces sp. NPDC038707]|uniref:RHS repeat-associated core domain-containing protein n=1 Tax=Streptomyces sp. NPDC038707 TaxID=3154329 RepID=UPI0033D4455A
LVDVDGNKVDTYTYSPRGVRLLAQSSEPVDQPYRFAGNYQDPTGLYHLQARYYDANTGRFTQPDPSGQEKNPYLYAEGDPVNRIDPTGTISLGGAIDDGKEVYDAVSSAAQGDTDALVAQASGIAAGIVVESACQFVAGFAGAPTAGAGAVAVEAGCGYASTAVATGPRTQSRAS